MIEAVRKYDTKRHGRQSTLVLIDDIKSGSSRLVPIGNSSAQTGARPRVALAATSTCKPLTVKGLMTWWYFRMPRAF
jgi:hypothetical protein